MSQTKLPTEKFLLFFLVSYKNILLGRAHVRLLQDPYGEGGSIESEGIKTTSLRQPVK
jgi:hypothetical protein